jgi:hypothetical protein
MTVGMNAGRRFVSECCTCLRIGSESCRRRAGGVVREWGDGGVMGSPEISLNRILLDCAVIRCFLSYRSSAGSVEIPSQLIRHLPFRVRKRQELAYYK